MIDCVHYFGHLLRLGVPDPGLPPPLPPNSSPDTLEAIVWLLHLMNSLLLPLFY